MLTKNHKFEREKGNFARSKTATCLGDLMARIQAEIASDVVSGERATKFGQIHCTKNIRLFEPGTRAR